MATKGLHKSIFLFLAKLGSQGGKDIEELGVFSSIV